MRIRTVKPEFWESETIASLSLQARLLFLATLNAADDEGLLRWNAALLKSTAFVYDDEVGTEQVREWMDELVREQLILPYTGGKTNSKYGWIVSFREHQKINRPQKSKLPAPSLQNAQVREAYARRDNYTCQITGQPIESLVQRTSGDKFSLSLDHITPTSKGGSNHPSNIRATIQKANKGRGNNEDYTPSDYVQEPSVSRSVNDSVNDSLSERKGKEGKVMERNDGKEGEGSGGARTEPTIEDCEKVAASFLPADQSDFATSCGRSFFGIYAAQHWRTRGGDDLLKSQVWKHKLRTFVEDECRKELSKGSARGTLPTNEQPADNVLGGRQARKVTDLRSTT